MYLLILSLFIFEIEAGTYYRKFPENSLLLPDGAQTRSFTFSERSECVAFAGEAGWPFGQWMESTKQCAIATAFAFKVTANKSTETFVDRKQFLEYSNFLIKCSQVNNSLIQIP